MLLTTLSQIHAAVATAASERDLRACWEAARAIGCQADGTVGQAIQAKARLIGADTLATTLMHQASQDARARES